jgi:hypothetical protein
MTTAAAVDKLEMDWTRNQIVYSATHVAVGAARISLLGSIMGAGSRAAHAISATKAAASAGAQMPPSRLRTFITMPSAVIASA